ncbi:hypothetical protein BJ122_12614 [Rhodopseudomonas faecalis]|uniref:Uncharacterized protein n=1 Tax=Rhodopseudomonas faecalis TaxID=99655 RepID=A0A318T943_9BRAD|nr:hypothetical protein [Rhodopseudomonas faecalis]PYF01136.1 hypothetical protein BJ122_12614 [Rhodopseudomonas faecalis]
MKKLVVTTIIAVCAFFIVGGAAAYFGKLDKEIYIVVTGIVGGLASVIGLVGLFSKSSITANDMRKVEVELVQGLADTMKTVNEYESRISTNRQEIDRLEKERAEIELLVRQASLKVFLEEKLRYIAEEIDKRVGADTRLIELLSDYDDASSQVVRIGGQIQQSERAELIQQVLSTVSRANGNRSDISDDIIRIFAEMLPGGEIMRRAAVSIIKLYH